jgi:hypothetical protein
VNCWLWDFDFGFIGTDSGVNPISTIKSIDWTNVFVIIFF